MSLPDSSMCPPWCVSLHDPARGEDDWVHESEPLVLAENATAFVVMSIVPETGDRDGPYVLVGDNQLDPADARKVGQALIALASLALTHPGPGEAA